MKLQRIIAVLSIATCVVMGLAVWQFSRKQVDTTVAVPECRLILLDRAERLARANAPPKPPRIKYAQVWPRPVVPEHLGDNPIVLADHFAIVVFSNTTASSIEIYSIRRKHDNLAPFEDAFRVKTEVTTPEGVVLKVLDPTQSMVEDAIPELSELKKNADVHSLAPNAVAN